MCTRSIWEAIKAIGKRRGERRQKKNNLQKSVSRKLSHSLPRSRPPHTSFRFFDFSFSFSSRRHVLSGESGCDKVLLGCAKVRYLRGSFRYTHTLHEVRFQIDILIANWFAFNAKQKVPRGALSIGKVWLGNLLIDFGNIFLPLSCVFRPPIKVN